MNTEILESARYCINEFDCKNCYMDGGNCSCIVVFAKAILEHHDRYRWHDLRKDPNDLPQISDEEYMVVEEWDDGDRIYSTANSDYIWYHSNDNDLPYRVIGWCEINHFESEV